MKILCTILVGLMALTAPWAATEDDPQTNNQQASGSSGSRRAAQRALEPFNDWVGTWRGVGQPKRGSNKGAWTEEADWAWRIGRDTAALQVKIKDGKLFESGLVEYNASAKKFQFTAQLTGGGSRTYVGDRAEEGKIVLIGSDSDQTEEQRLSFVMRHADRLLLLVEAKARAQPSFSRVAEIGYTRKGGSFATTAELGPKCIVTGGRGTLTAEYKGKTYYFCCTGCKQAFQDDPEGIIAEAAERAKKEARERKDK